MDEVIEKFSSFVETLYANEKPNDASVDNTKSIFNDHQYDTAISNSVRMDNGNKVPNNSEVYESLNEIYPKVKEVAQNSLELNSDNKTNYNTLSFYKTSNTVKEPAKVIYEKSRNHGFQNSKTASNHFTLGSQPRQHTINRP